MTKKDILDLRTVASVNVYGGLEIKKIINGYNDYIIVVSGIWNGKPKVHKLKVYYTESDEYFNFDGRRVHLSDCIKVF